MATESNLASSDRIGEYRYVRTIAAGVHSRVLEVVQEATGRRFAVKELLDSKAQDPAERRIFEAEARLGMEFSHPNLIRVLDFVKDKTAPYFVMDYFPSDHLKLVLSKRERADWLKERLRRIVTQSAAALAYMHDRGWTHRDVKPENIIVNKSGEVRLIDFALAKRIPSGLLKLFAGKPEREGTQSYMSPEQIRRESPSAAADIYSFGCTCYELACGRPPFRANSTQELLTKHLREQPAPLTQHNPELTSEFSELVLQTLRKTPADRPASMHEFLSRLGRVRIYKDENPPKAASGL